jgi:predicted RNA-binding Zn-ribbon protein involved in translation (DUF1610 family)
MRRADLRRWATRFFERHSSRCCDDENDREELAKAFARELPGVLVGDDYLKDMDEMLGLHATMLEAEHQVAETKAKEPRPDGTPKVTLIAEVAGIEERREVVADLRIAIEERRDLVCPECGTSPPATLCKMSCDTKMYRGATRIPMRPLRDIVFAEGEAEKWVVTLSCGHKKYVGEKKVSYPCNECEEDTVP